MEPGENQSNKPRLREIVEETGMEGLIIAPIDQIKYKYNHETKGIIDKEVHYYLVEAIGGKLQAQVEEIRGVEWFDPPMPGDVNDNPVTIIMTVFWAGP